MHEEEHISDKEKGFYYFEKQEVMIDDFQSSGWVLDIGGAGKGVGGNQRGDRIFFMMLQKHQD
jgi:hypothetical protein